MSSVNTYAEGSASGGSRNGRWKSEGKLHGFVSCSIWHGMGDQQYHIIPPFRF